jgi:hypothetical protein
MTFRGRKLQLTVIAGLLLIMLGLRDFFAPGFLNIDSRFWGIDATDKLLAGILVVALGLLHRMRWRGI